MTRFTRLFCLFFIVWCYSLSIMCAVETLPLKTFPSPMPASLSDFFDSHRCSQEGFCGNTLVQTPFGCQPIRNLVSGDVVIDSNGQPKKIVAIVRKYVDKHVRLVVNNTVIKSGSHQCYCLNDSSSWLAAEKILVGTVLSNSSGEFCQVTQAQLVQKPTILYCLTVEDHIFSIEHNGLLVHNSPELVMCASSICLVHVMVANPVAVTVGVAVALSAIGHKAYQAYREQYGSLDEKIVLPTEVVLAERSYYNQRATALERVKQELLAIKNGLENIRAFCFPYSETFTYQFLQKTSISNVYSSYEFLKVSDKRESLLSDGQKEDLRKLREMDLQHREQEIIDLHYMLALHFDQLVEQLYSARDDYMKAQEQINSAIGLWNNNLNNMTYAIALPLYKADLLEEYLLNNCNQKLNELKVVVQYYTNCTNILCVEQSTNIIELLESLVPVITEYDQWVTAQKARVDKNIVIAEQHFIRRGVLVPPLKNQIRNELAASRRNVNAQALAGAKNKLVSIAVAGGPNKNNNKNDDDKDNDESNKDLSNKKNTLKTMKEATEAAEKLGFEKTNYYSMGRPVFRKGNRYITPDRTGHNGGIWKMANSVKNLENRAVRMGTYDKYLNRIGD